MNRPLPPSVYFGDDGGNALNQERQHRTGAGSLLRRQLPRLGLVLCALGLCTPQIAASAGSQLQARRTLENAAHDVREAADALQGVCTQITRAGRLERLDTLHQRVETLRHQVDKLRVKVNSID